MRNERKKEGGEKAEKRESGGEAVSGSGMKTVAAQLGRATVAAAAPAFLYARIFFTCFAFFSRKRGRRATGTIAFLRGPRVSQKFPESDGPRPRGTGQRRGMFCLCESVLQSHAVRVFVRAFFLSALYARRRRPSRLVVDGCTPPSLMEPPDEQQQRRRQRPCIQWRRQSEVAREMLFLPPGVERISAAQVAIVHGCTARVVLHVYIPVRAHCDGSRGSQTGGRALAATVAMLSERPVTRGLRDGRHEAMSE